MNKGKMKKIIISLTLVLILVPIITSCGEKNQIYPVSREEGSGTRSAFVELAGICDENKKDMLTQKAEVTNSTAVMLQTIKGNKNAIGYVSLGSLTEDVKAVRVEENAATAENIEKGKYKIARTFNVVTKNKINDLSKDFINFILSKEGQKIVEAQGYIKEEKTLPYEKKKNIKGKLTIAGSTSVAPVVEVIGASYMKMYPDVKIEIQQSGSSAGIIAVEEGVCDIGLSSRELEGDEKTLEIKSLEIAKDGIVVIVALENNITSLTDEEIRQIFTGEIRSWNQLKESYKEKEKV